MSYSRYVVTADQLAACAGNYGTPGAANPFATATDPGILFEYGPRSTAVRCEVWHPRWGVTPADCQDVINGTGLAPVPLPLGGELAIRLEAANAAGYSRRYFGTSTYPNHVGVYQAAKNAVFETSFILYDVANDEAQYQIGFTADPTAADESLVYLSFRKGSSGYFRLYSRTGGGGGSGNTATSIIPTAGVRYYMRITLVGTAQKLYLGTTYAGMTLAASTSRTNATSMCCTAQVRSTPGGGGSIPKMDVFDVRAYQNA